MTEDATERDTEHSAHEVVAHLQAAAVELIAAARAFLDVAEELVRDPGGAVAMAAAAAAAARGTDASSPASTPSRRVEHIRVS